MKSYLLLIACIALLASCSSTHKVKTSVFKKIDSTSTSASQASGKRSVDSGTTKILKQSHKDGITINFADEDELDIATENPVEKANDLAGPQRSLSNVPFKYRFGQYRPGNHTVNIDGKTIFSDRPIKSIDIRNSGKTSVVDRSQFSKKDSGQESQSAAVAVTKVEEKKNKDVDRHGASVLIWIGLGVAIIAGFIVAARLGAFRKRNFDA